MSKWSSFEQDREYANNWRQYLESEELEEAVLDKAKEKLAAAGDRVSKAKGGAQKAGAGLEKGRQAATGAYDWIANFLGGKFKDKDYSHLKMPTPDSPTAKGAEEDAATTQKKREEDEAWKQHRGEPGAGAQKQAQKDPSQQHSDPDLASHDAQYDAAAKQKTDGAQEEEPKDKKKTISRDPDSALNESQTYDRWKVLSGIKKKVI
jgi:hypothetical protein